MGQEFDVLTVVTKIFCETRLSMKLKKLLSVILIILSNVIGNESYNILGIFHTTSRSHYIAGGALMRGLADKGHDVTVISPYPQNKPIKNFHDIPITGMVKLVEELLPRSTLIKTDNLGLAEKLNLFSAMGVGMTNYTLRHEVLQHFLQTNDIRFDVIIMEVFLNEAFLGIGHYLNAPVIGFLSFTNTKSSNDMVGTPTPMSYVPHILVKFDERMSFLQRVTNVIAYVIDELYTNWFYMPEQVKIYDAIFPDPKPTLDELQKNVSLVLLNNHFSLSFSRPFVPNMIEVGGLQINRTPRQLPLDLQKIMDEAVNGIIYFSLGSNIRSKHIPFEKQREILIVFRKLKQTILWKWDEPLTDGKPANVHVSAWYPQDDILAHPNVKLFITHGGLLSITETIYHAVPIIGIPFFADQQVNMARAEKLGYAKTIQLKDLNQKSLSTAIAEVLTNYKYRNQIKLQSERYRDQPMTPLETAIYWTEYVARHKGAPHLRSTGLNLSFFAYHSLDVFAVLSVALSAVFYLIWRLVKWSGCRIVLKICEKNIDKTKKDD